MRTTESYEEHLSELAKHACPNLSDLPDSDAILSGIYPERELTYDEKFALINLTITRIRDNWFSINKKTNVLFDSQFEKFVGFLLDYTMPELVIYAMRILLSLLHIKITPGKNFDRFSEIYTPLILG